MKNIISIADWDSYKNIKKLQHEIDAYVHILDYLINTKRTEETLSIEYYEKKYVVAYVDFIEMKMQFQEHLKQYLLNNNILVKYFDWHINFERNEVEVIFNE